MQYAPRRFIRYDGFEPGLSVESAKALLAQASIDFTEATVADVSETVVRLSLPNRTEMEFFRMNGRPSLAEIQLFPENEGG